MSRRTNLFVGIFTTFALLVGALGFAATPVSAGDWTTWKTDYAAKELMRLINADRAARGLRVLAVDTRLVGLNRDSAITCPNNTTLSHAGMAKDQALNDWFSHSLRKCTQYRDVDVMPRYGYSSMTRGTILAWNGGWGVTKTTQKLGCAYYSADPKQSQERCTSTKTTASTRTVVKAHEQWLESSGHRNIMLNPNMNRIGCGAWFNPNTNKNFYSCWLSYGGPTGTVDGTAPTVSVTGSGVTVKGTTPVVFSATYSDNFRLAEGNVKLDGKVMGDWGHDLNVKSYKRTLSIVPANLTVGTHTIQWVGVDMANKSVVRNITFNVTR